ncbi:MAG: metallophosphoesterase, partial [Planctomycetota bacterium]
TFTLDGQKVLVNVGSVGQPRDSNPHSCYVLLQGNTITYRRVSYDTEAVRQKIYRIPELENYLGDRLLKGR